MHLWYDRQGKQISTEECARLWANPNYRQVADDQVGESRVSTVWLGPGCMPDWRSLGGPMVMVIFETMVFGGPLDEQQWRYATEAEALAGHATAVRAVQDAQLPPTGSREDRIMPDDTRPIAEPEPGSVDISGLDKAELLAALVNAAGRASPFVRLARFTHEQAAAIIQDNLGAGSGRPFHFDYVDGRPIKCDIGGQRICAFHVARYDRDAGDGTAARVVAELRSVHERRRAERETRT